MGGGVCRESGSAKRWRSRLRVGINNLPRRSRRLILLRRLILIRLERNGLSQRHSTRKYKSAQKTGFSGHAVFLLAKSATTVLQLSQSYQIRLKPGFPFRHSSCE